MDLLSEGNKSSQQSAQTATPVYAHNTSDSDTASRVEALIAELRATGRDITADYGDWLKVGFALASEFERQAALTSTISAPFTLATAGKKVTQSTPSVLSRTMEELI